MHLQPDSDPSYAGRMGGMIEIQRVRRTEAEQARGVAIVIDVIRAFTVAAYALANGARCLHLVRTAEEAFALRALEPGALLAGEIGGRLIAGFDHNNSPAQMAAADVRGRVIIQRTGAGTQGAVDAMHADRLLVAALVNARATALYARQLATQSGHGITLMPTNTGDDPRGIEDELCADYLEALLCRPADAPRVLQEALMRLSACGRLEMFHADDADFPADDVPAFLAVDRFPFAMEGWRQERNGISYVNAVRADPFPPSL